MGLYKFMDNEDLVINNSTQKTVISNASVDQSKDESATSYQLFNDDSKKQLKTLSSASIDCVITDPPYGYRK